MEKKYAVIVPVFNPEPGLLELCERLVREYSLVIVVDDGSTENVDSFSKLPAGITLLRHESNCGKGRAIKTALEWLLKLSVDVQGAVFVDGDGQHRPHDVSTVVLKSLETGNVTLGVRDFKKEGIPFRSRFGNVITSFLVRRMFHIAIWDTQTGLRSIPRRLFRNMIELPGERYEYEMRLFRMLRTCHEKLEQVPIETVYIENNRASHFRPIQDSLKIYHGLLGSSFVSFCSSSLASFLLDNAVFTVMIYAIQALDILRRYEILISLVTARLISGAFNYYCNRRVVFKSNVSIAGSAMRYACLAVVVGLLSYSFTASISAFLDAHGVVITSIKIVVESLLFLVSYRMQKVWVFEGGAIMPVRDAMPLANLIKMQLLVLPAVVITVMSVLFAFGFSCLPWVWWCSIVVVMGLPFAVVDFKVAIKSVILFVVFLAALWITSNAFVAFHSGPDVFSCHFPAVRLMVLGWNPFTQGTPECIERLFNIASSDLTIWHILYGYKSVWMFNAAAYFFTHATYNLMWPLYFIVLLCTILTIMTRFVDCSLYVRAVMCLIVVALFPGARICVDAVVALGGLGLLINFWLVLHKREWCWLELVAYSYLMCVAKLPGMVHCVAFWFLFVGAMAIRKGAGNSGSSVKAAGTFCLLLCLSQGLSYIYSFKNLGGVVPRRNLVADFNITNADAEQMGFVGSYVNGYVSSTLAKEYYKCKLGIDEFRPSRAAWGKADSPTSSFEKFIFCFSIIVLLVYGGFAGRFVAVSVVAGTAMMPTSMLGFTRYTPWCFSPIIFCVQTLLSLMKCKLVRRSLLVVVSIYLLWFAIIWPTIMSAINVDTAWSIEKAVNGRPPMRLYAAFQDVPSDMSRCKMSNLALLRRMDLRLAKSEIVFDDSCEKSKHKMFFDHSCKVEESYPLEQFSEYHQLVNCNDGGSRLLKYPQFAMRQLLLNLPRLMLSRLGLKH